MEAIVAAPAPPSPQVKNVHTEQSGDDSTFAPTLAKALSDKQTSRNDQSPAEGRPNSNTTIKEDTDTVEEQSAAAAGVVQLHQERRQTASNGEAHQKNDRLLAGPGSPFISLPAQTAFISSADTATISSALKNTTQAETGAFMPTIASALKNGGPAGTGKSGIDLAQTGKAGDQGIRLRAAAFSSPTAITGSMQAGAPQSPTVTFQSGRNPLEMMQQNDAVSWSRLSSDKQQDFFQKPLSMALTEETMVTSQERTPVSTEKLLAGLSQITADGKNPVPLRNGDQVSLRQAISGQLFEAKTETADSGGEQKGAQQFLGGESNSARQVLTTATAKTADSSAESSFSQSLSQAGGDKISQPAADPMRPGAMPFTTAVSDNEILQQMVNKFRISQHMQDSKITMKLHPAELGNLKIDIQLKDGTINANIAAQTQRVQEILEKNMPRLKALMEEQGLQVEDIIIRLDSDLPSEHNLFDEQLSQQGSFSEDTAGRPRSVFTMETALEEEDVAEHTQDPGVNVTI